MDNQDITLLNTLGVEKIYKKSSELVKLKQRIIIELSKLPAF